jgi:hypothetical protein
MPNLGTPNLGRSKLGRPSTKGCTYGSTNDLRPTTNDLRQCSMCGQQGHYKTTCLLRPDAESDEDVREAKVALLAAQANTQMKKVQLKRARVRKARVAAEAEAWIDVCRSL